MRARGGSLLIAAGLVLLAGCAGVDEAGLSGWNHGSDVDDSCAPLGNDQRLVVNISGELEEEGRLHAALANLESLPHQLDEVRWRKARILRLLGSNRAKGLYLSLLDGCFAAEGYHGLGQLAIADNDYEQALNYLRKAARLAPVNAAIRNDLGLAYLHLRRLGEAGFELRTAMELNPEGRQPVDNLLTLLVYADQWQQASELIAQLRLPPRRFQSAEARARQLWEEDEWAGRASPLNKHPDQTVPTRSR